MLNSKSAPADDVRPEVLIVDDDPSVLGALRRLLRAANFRVRTFDCPSALLSAELPHHNACLLLDVYLPEMNGVELKHALEAHGHHLPAIMITGNTDLGTRKLLDEAHLLSLVKPFDESLLLNAIAAVLAENPRADS